MIHVLSTTSGTTPWEFVAHPDVWLLVFSLVAGYAAAIRYLGPSLAPKDAPVVTRKQVLTFAAGVFVIWSFSDWPVHDLSEGYLFWVHMTQHTMFSLVAPPLLILGTPAWLQRWLLSPPALRAFVRRMCRPLPASLLFNFVVAITHWPKWVDVTLHSELAHFGAHALLVVAALIMWLPIVNAIPDIVKALSYPVRMLYLFLQSILPTLPASFLAFAERPLYRFYETAPRISGMTTVEDQQLAGAIMKVGGTTLIWGVIVVMFFKWYAESQRDQGDVLTWEDVQRELDRTKPAVPNR